MRRMMAVDAGGNAALQRLLCGYRDLPRRVDSGHGVPFDLPDNTPMTCFALRADGTVMHANRFGARYLGYRPEDLIDRPIFDSYLPDDRGLAHENLAGADTPGKVYRWDIRHIRKNGK